MILKTKPMVQKYLLKQKVNSEPDRLDEYCKHIKNWAASWKISVEDLVIGQAITEQFKQFLISRIEKGRAKRTLKRYADYLWVLGGELIRHLNEDETERCLIAPELILKYIDDNGGPYWRHARDESEHAEYDSVCRQLFKYIIDNAE